MRIFSKDIKVAFRHSKCATVVMRREKLVRTESISSPSGEMMKVVQPQSNYNYLGIFEEDGIRFNEELEKCWLRSLIPET